MERSLEDLVWQRAGGRCEYCQVSWDTLDLPFEEVDRLSKKPGLTAIWTPVSTIAFMHFNNIGIMSDPNIRKAAVHAIDKKAISNALFSGKAPLRAGEK